jgi:hypothetical protein
LSRPQLKHPSVGDVAVDHVDDLELVPVQVHDAFRLPLMLRRRVAFERYHNANEPATMSRSAYLWCGRQEGAKPGSHYGNCHIRTVRLALEELESAAARETAHPLQPFRGHQCGERLALARDDERVVTERDPIEQIADTL